MSLWSRGVRRAPFQQLTGRLESPTTTAPICRLLSTSVLLASPEAPSRGMPFTTELVAASTPHATSSPLPCYQVLNNEGNVTDPNQDPQLSDEVVLDIYKKMVTLRLMDEQLYKAQRMGIISFYMMCTGEEATHFGSAVALDDEDMIYAQYREAGVLMWRGFTVEQCMHQCFSTRQDLGRGRQMPVHYGSKDHNYQFISSCLATQMPQAPGYAYGLKLAGSKNCVMVYFGDGAAQEGDSHAAMNFAATLKTPTVFFCRNNGYAISTPSSENYVGDGIVSRAIGYGMEGVRVDGNDVLAIYNATKYARKVAVDEQRPVLIEAMTLRIDSHSTSDDQTGYQDMDEVKEWKDKSCPIMRFRRYLESRGLWDESKEAELLKAAAGEVRRSMQKARSELKPPLDDLFNDVYDKLPPRLEKQREEMWRMVNKYKKHYPTDLYES